jgi:segregation and condensation protein B
VNSDYSIQKLLEKELIIISGRNEHLPGRPLVYATSQNFMDYFGINSSGDLPEIKEVLADQIVEATVVKPEDFTDWPVAEETKADEELPTEETLSTEESNIDTTQAEADETPQPPAEA